MSHLAGQVHNVVRPITSPSELMDVVAAIATSSSVTAVNLSRCRFTLDAAQALATSLIKSAQGYGTVHLLRLVGCGLDSAMVGALSAPSACDRLEVIELAENAFGDAGCEYVAKIVAQSCLTLKSLDLADCSITVAGAAKLVPVLAATPSPMLRSLVLTNNELRAPGVAALCDGLRGNTSIVDLDLSGNSINCDAGPSLARLLTQNKNIQCLSLSANYISMGAAKVLAALVHRDVPLRLLDISDNHVDDETCRAAARALNGAHVDVVCLSLQRNHITNDGFVALYHLLRRSPLQFLDVSRLQLTEGSSLAISDLIRHCEVLGSLQLDGNQLGDDAIVEILFAVIESKSMTSLNIERTGVGQRAADVVVNSLSRANKLRTLSIADNPIDTLTVLRMLQSFTTPVPTTTHLSAAKKREMVQSRLEVLDLSNLPLPETENVQHALLELFAHNAALREVTLEFCGVSAALPERRLTRELVQKLTAARTAAAESDGSGANGSVNASGALVALGGASPAPGQQSPQQQRGALGGAVARGRAEGAPTVRMHVHRPAWAPITAVNVRGAGQHNNNNNSNSSGSHLLADEIDDREAEDITHMPYEPDRNSLMHALYPSFGLGRFSNASSVSSLSYSLPFNMAHGTLTTKPIWPARGDGSHLFQRAPRRAAMRSLFSLDQLERNVGQLPVTDEQLRLKFAELDVEGKGCLARDEFTAFYKGLQGFGIPHTDKEVARVMGKYLAPGGGRVTYDEFCLVMLNFAAR